MGSIVLIGGGVRSGKSDFALTLARQRGHRRLFLATAEPLDDEMETRIAAHRRERGPDFETVEAPLALAPVVREHVGFDVMVLDCLTLWITNLLLRGDSTSQILQRIDELIETMQSFPGAAIAITNEVGMGLVPETALGRKFRDLAGAAHRRFSKAADEVYLAVLGTILQIKPTLRHVGEL